MALIPVNHNVVFWDPTDRLYQTANQANANTTDFAYTMQDIIDTVIAGGSTPGINDRIPVYQETSPGQFTLAPSAASITYPSVPGANYMILRDAYSMVLSREAQSAGGDPEFVIVDENFGYKVSMGWDDDGDGFGYLYNWAGDGWRIGASGNNPMLEVVTTAGSESVNLHKQVEFVDYGSGTYTGTAAFSLAVDASGNVIETAAGGGGATFDSSNSEATPHIVLGADAKANAPAGGADGVYICASSFGSATSSDEQINIGRDNDTNGTQSVAIGIDNSATTNSPYGMMFGKNNTTAGTRTWAIGEGNNMGTPDTVTFGKDNSSTFTGGVSSGGLMNFSVGNANEVDCDKAIVVGWNNDLSGSFGWTIGGGKEVVVLGTRFSNTLLGPNRSGTDRSGPRVIIGTGSALNTGAEEKRNSVEYYQPEATHSGVYHPALYNSASYADDAAASAGGVGLGELYRNGSVVQIRMT